MLHAVPGLTVDVYANGEELIPDFAPGTLTDPLTLPAGSYDLQVFAAGDNPDNADPAIEAQGVEVPAGANATVVAHLDADGNPVLTPFVNDVSSTDAGQARLIVRHTPPHRRWTSGPTATCCSRGWRIPTRRPADVPAGAYSADVTLAGENETVIGPADLELAEGTATIVYAWGSAEDGNLDLAVQTIDGLHSAPSGVPGGETGAAAAGDGAPLWAFGLGAASLLALGVAGTRLVPARTRR